MKLLGIAGWKNSGKTSLVVRLIAEFGNRGISVSTIKHSHHSFDIDKDGTDSFRHREAGAHEVIISSMRRWAIMHNLGNESEPGLFSLLSKLEEVDLVLVEGFKRTKFPKIEIRRLSAKGKELYPDDKSIIAIASDYELGQQSIPVHDLNNTSAIADFISQNVLSR